MLVLTDIRELCTPHSPNDHILPYLNQIIRYNLIPVLLVDVKDADTLIVSG